MKTVESEAFKKGKQSYEENKPNQNGVLFFRRLGQNPYEIGSYDYYEWERGYTEEFIKNWKGQRA